LYSGPIVKMNFYSVWFASPTK